MKPETITRINELAHKAKTTGLTAEEEAERANLRREYIENIRASVKQQLDNTYVETPDGKRVPYAEYARLHKEEKDTTPKN